MRSPRLRLVLALLASTSAPAACGGSDATTPVVSGADAGDAAPTTGEGGSPEDAGDSSTAPDAMPTCPESDAGAFGGACGNEIATPGATCLEFSPVATGASTCGANATNAEIAMTNDATRNGKLFLFFNGTGGSPRESLATPAKNILTAAAQLGYQVLAISYRSDESIGDQCVCADSCYFPSRESVIRGVYQTGAASTLQDVRVDEGIAARTMLALRWLAANDGAHGWSTFLTGASTGMPPENQIDWSKVVVGGHSQGGGHAAAVGKLFTVDRVVQLSSTCDVQTPTTDECTKKAATLSNVTSASWTSRANGTWATPATAYWGLDRKAVFNGAESDSWTSGDGSCFRHTDAWAAEGAPVSQQNDAEETCSATTLLQFHEASVECEANFANWQAMLR